MNILMYHLYTFISIATQWSLSIKQTQWSSTNPWSSLQQYTKTTTNKTYKNIKLTTEATTTIRTGWNKTTRAFYTPPDTTQWIQQPKPIRAILARIFATSLTWIYYRSDVITMLFQVACNAHASSTISSCPPNIHKYVPNTINNSIITRTS